MRKSMNGSSLYDDVQPTAKAHRYFIAIKINPACFKQEQMFYRLGSLYFKILYNFKFLANGHYRKTIKIFPTIFETRTTFK